MKINIQTKGVIITAKQKSLIEKKIAKMKKYLSHDEPATIDVILIDDTGDEKGGVDQVVHLNVVFGKEKIFIEEADNRFMRAFAYALDRLDRNLKRYHKREIDSNQKIGDERIEKVFGIIKRNRKK